MNRIIFFLISILIVFDLHAQAAKFARISKIHLVENFHVKKSKLISEFGLKENQPYIKSDIPDAVKKLERYLSDQGYLFARVDSVQAVYNDDSSRVALLIHGNCGESVRFGKIHIQSDSLKNNLYYQQLTIAENELYSESIVERDMSNLLALAADHGYPYAEVTIKDITLRKTANKSFADFELTIHEKRKVFIKNIILKGNVYTKDRVILRELAIQPESVYSKKEIKKIPRHLNHLGIFKNVKEPSILSAENDSVYLQIEVEEGNSTTFDGVVGYIPGQTGTASQDGYFTGLIDLSFKNLFGTSRKFNVHWKKPDKYSEEFEIAYTEPWILGYPVDMGLGLDRTVRDTTYIDWGYHLNLRLRIFTNFSLIANVKRRKVIPDSAASRDLRLLRNQVTNAEIGIEYDTRDYPINPRSGLFYKSSYSYGFKNNFGPSYLFVEDSLSKQEQLQSIKVQFNWYFNLWSNQVFAIQINGMQIKGDQLQLTDYFWFGGSRSLRGYRENQFRGDIVAWVNLEYRFILNRNSRLFLFNDWGFYQCPLDDKVHKETLPGYGIGIRFETPLGILGVDYGLGKDDSFRQGKIHFGIINRF